MLKEGTVLKNVSETGSSSSSSGGLKKGQILTRTQEQKDEVTRATAYVNAAFNAGPLASASAKKQATDTATRIPSANYNATLADAVKKSETVIPFEDKAALESAKAKYTAGKDWTESERNAVQKYGLGVLLSGNTTAEFDIAAKDSDGNKARRTRMKPIIEKLKKGETLTESENDTFETFKLINDYNKDTAKAAAVMTSDTDENASKIQSVKAKKLYNDTAYKSDTLKVGNVEVEADKNNVIDRVYSDVQRKGNRVNLYVDTGLNQYAEGLNTTVNVVLGRTDPEKIAKQADSAYTTASAMLKEYYAQNGEKFNQIVQDVVTNIANNAPGMITGVLTKNKLASTAVFGVSVFGNAYREAAKLGVTDKTKVLWYSIATTASECLLEYAIGGLPGVGGALSGEVLSKLSEKVGSSVLKAVIKIAGNAVGEFIEEGTQSLLSPLLQKYILGLKDTETVVDNPAGALSGAAYEGFIGALTSVLTGGIGSYAEAKYETDVQRNGRYYKTVFSNNKADVKNVAKFFDESSGKKSEVKKYAQKVANGDTSDLAVGQMMIAVSRETQKTNAALFAKIGENVKSSEDGVSAVISAYENAVNEDGSIFPDKVEKLYNEVRESENVSDELLGEFALAVQTYSPRANIIGKLVSEAFGTETEAELAGAEGADADINATDGESNLNDDAVLHDPEIGDIAVGLDMFDTYKGSDGEQHLKTSRHKHIESFIAKTGVNLIWSSNVGRGKYIPSTKTIMLNPEISTSKAYNFVLKHEFTHYLESKKGYAEFKDYVFENSQVFEDWVQDKLQKAGVSAEGSREQIIKRLTEEYFNEYTHSAELSEYLRKKFTMSNAEEELLADFVGENLLGTKEKLDETLFMLSEMKQKKRGLFEKIRDFFRDLIHKFKGNKSLKGLVNDLEYLNDRLERLAQSEDNKKITATEGDVKYRIEYTTDNKPVAVIEEDILDGVPKSDWVKTVKETISKKFLNGIPIGGRLVKVNKITRNEYTNSEYSKALKSNDGTIYADKFKSANNLDDIVLASTNYINEDLKHSRKDNFKEFARGDVLIRVGNNDYSAKVIVGFTNGNQMVLYDVVDFNPTTIDIKERTPHTAMQKQEAIRSVMSSASSISDTADFVNENISETDSEGNKLSSEQQKYFADSKVRSKDGNLLVMYHGTKTENGDFYVFDSSKAVKKGGLGLNALGKGNYFTSKKLDGTERFGSRVIEAYLNITNPFVYDGANGDIVSLAQQVEKDTGISTEGMTADELQNKMRELGYDGVIEYRRDGSLGIAVAFDSEQIKEIGNTSPTSNPDIRYSIPVTEMDKLLDKYDKGEITREEYYRRINYRVNRDVKKRTEKYKERTEKSEERVERYKERTEKYKERTEKSEERVERYKERTEKYKAAAEKYIADWEKKNGALMRRTIEANEIREEAIRNERKEQAIRKDRESSIYFIRRSVKRLDHALRTNSKAKHIPESLKGAVTEFCKLFAENDAATFEHKDLADIASYYKQVGNEKTDRTKYDPFILECLDVLAEMLPGKKLTELNQYELETVRNISDALNFAVKEEESVFLDGKRATLEEAGERILEEIPTMKAKFPKLNNDFLEFFTVGNAKPIYFFKSMPGDFGKAFQGCLDGQDKFGLKMVRGQDFIDTTKNKYGYDIWKNQTITLEVRGGKTYTITVEQAIQLVATAERQRTNEVQAAEHLNVGGVVFDTERLEKVYKAQRKVKKSENSEKKKGLDAAKNELKRAVEKLKKEPIQLTFGDIDNLSKKLTDDQKGYMKEFVDFLSTECAAWGNEVTMEMYGYRQYNEKNYFPYVSAEAFLYTDPTAGTDNALRHASFTNSLQKHANNPLVISSFTDVAIAHIEQMASYNAMTAPVETLNKIFNYKTVAVAATDGHSGIPSRSVKDELELKFGKAAVKYIENFIRDVNNGVRGDSRDSFVNAMSSKFKKTAVLGNLSVIFQQPFAVIRACVDLDFKYMLSASKYNAKNNYEEMKQFAPVAIIKQMGSFDTGVGLKNSTWLSGEQTFMESVDEFLGKGAEKADEIAWSFLWSACKAEIANTTNLEFGSEAFLEAAGKRISDLINRTQVYDSVLSKSQNMRNKGAAGALTSFMGEPTTEINMLYDAFTDFVQGKASGKQLVRTTTVLISSSLFTAIAQGLAYAMRDKDEDKSFLEKWAYQSVSNFVGNLNPLSKIPYIRDIFSIWDGYDVERQDISIVSDVVTAAKALTTGEPSFYKVRRLAEAVASLYGIPAKNVLRDIEATVRTFLQMFDDNTPTVEGIWESILEGVSENDIIAIFTGKKS